MWLLDGRAFPLARPLLSALQAPPITCVTPLVAYFWLRYCDFHIYQRLWPPAPPPSRSTCVPFALNAALCVSSVWTGAVFYLDAGNVYHRGPWFCRRTAWWR